MAVVNLERKSGGQLQAESGGQYQRKMQFEWEKTNLRGFDAGDKLKSATGWSQNGNGTNGTGFSGLAGGGKYGGNFVGTDDTGVWWSGSENSGYYGWNRYLSPSSQESGRDVKNKGNGLSVRCLKDM